MKKDDLCPFKVGQNVIYMPSQRGKDLLVMSSENQKLIPGELYEIDQVLDDLYVVPKGYSHPGGGLYWTEFKSC